MLGAIIGDIVGSRFEFNNIKTKDFELFTKESTFTDDTVLTIAVADWMLHAKDHSDQKEGAEFLQKWARRYPNAGFGGMFYRWKDYENPRPYNSCGNGSAMRISPVGFLLEDEEEVIKHSDYITGVTHNHPEGMKGARVVASMIYMARQGVSKNELREYAISEYPEIASLDYEELRRTYVHGAEICQVTVPQAIYCFLISNDFEDCLRTTISIGGDCDTTSAISCAIAEAYYKNIPEEIVVGALKLLPSDMGEILVEAKEIIQLNDGYVHHKDGKLIFEMGDTEKMHYISDRFRIHQKEAGNFMYSLLRLKEMVFGLRLVPESKVDKSFYENYTAYDDEDASYKMKELINESLDLLRDFLLGTPDILCKGFIVEEQIEGENMVPVDSIFYKIHENLKYIGKYIEQLENLSKEDMSA